MQRIMRRLGCGNLHGRHTVGKVSSSVCEFYKILTTRAIDVSFEPHDLRQWLASQLFWGPICEVDWTLDRAIFRGTEEIFYNSHGDDR